MEIPPIEQMKIQAQVLVPLVKTLQAKLGEEKANSLVREALGNMYRDYGKEWWKSQGQGNLAEKMSEVLKTFASSAALDYEVLKHDPDAYDFNITGCSYAQFYKELGVPELGFLLVCSQDFPLTEGFSPDIELKRTQTIMQGASHCDFRFALRNRAKA